MTTSPTPRDRTRPVDRLVNYVLDVDGDIYGDERERIRWYEGISLAASFQWLIVPWAMAILVWFADRDTVLFLVAVLALFYLPLLLTTAYVGSKGVRLLPERRSAKYWLFAALGGVPYLVFALGALVVHDGGAPDAGSWWAALVGGVVGGVLGLLGLVYAERLRRRKEDATPDGD